MAIDDASRAAYIEVLADEKGITCVGFLRRAIAYFRRLGLTCQQLLTDNGTGCSANGPTPGRTGNPVSGSEPCGTGSTTTIAGGRMAASTADHPTLG